MRRQSTLTIVEKPSPTKEDVERKEKERLEKLEIKKAMKIAQQISENYDLTQPSMDLDDSPETNTSNTNFKSVDGATLISQDNIMKTAVIRDIEMLKYKPNVYAKSGISSNTMTNIYQRRKNKVNDIVFFDAIKACCLRAQKIVDNYAMENEWNEMDTENTLNDKHYHLNINFNMLQDLSDALQRMQFEEQLIGDPDPDIQHLVEHPEETLNELNELKLKDKNLIHKAYNRYREYQVGQQKALEKELKAIRESAGIELLTNRVKEREIQTSRLKREVFQKQQFLEIVQNAKQEDLIHLSEIIRETLEKSAHEDVQVLNDTINRHQETIFELSLTRKKLSNKILKLRETINNSIWINDLPANDSKIEALNSLKTEEEQLRAAINKLEPELSKAMNNANQMMEVILVFDLKVDNLDAQVEDITIASVEQLEINKLKQNIDSLKSEIERNIRAIRQLEIELDQKASNSPLGTPRRNNSPHSATWSSATVTASELNAAFDYDETFLREEAEAGGQEEETMGKVSNQEESEVVQTGDGKMTMIQEEIDDEGDDIKENSQEEQKADASPTLQKANVLSEIKLDDIAPFESVTPINDAQVVEDKPQVPGDAVIKPASPPTQASIPEPVNHIEVIQSVGSNEVEMDVSPTVPVLHVVREVLPEKEMIPSFKAKSETKSDESLSKLKETPPQPNPSTMHSSDVNANQIAVIRSSTPPILISEMLEKDKTRGKTKDTPNAKKSTPKQAKVAVDDDQFDSNFNDNQELSGGVSRDLFENELVKHITNIFKLSDEQANDMELMPTMRNLDGMNLNVIKEPKKKKDKKRGKGDSTFGDGLNKKGMTAIPELEHFGISSAIGHLETILNVLRLQPEDHLNNSDDEHSDEEDDVAEDGDVIEEGEEDKEDADAESTFSYLGGPEFYDSRSQLIAAILRRRKKVTKQLNILRQDELDIKRLVIKKGKREDEQAMALKLTLRCMKGDRNRKPTLFASDMKLNGLRSHAEELAKEDRLWKRKVTQLLKKPTRATVIGLKGPETQPEPEPEIEPEPTATTVDDTTTIITSESTQSKRMSTVNMLEVFGSKVSSSSRSSVVKVTSIEEPDFTDDVSDDGIETHPLDAKSTISTLSVIEEIIEEFEHRMASPPMAKIKFDIIMKRPKLLEQMAEMGYSQHLLALRRMSESQTELVLESDGQPNRRAYDLLHDIDEHLLSDTPFIRLAAEDREAIEAPLQKTVEYIRFKGSKKNMDLEKYRGYLNPSKTSPSKKSAFVLASVEHQKRHADSPERTPGSQGHNQAPYSPGIPYPQEPEPRLTSFSPSAAVRYRHQQRQLISSREKQREVKIVNLDNVIPEQKKPQKNISTLDSDTTRIKQLEQPHDFSSSPLAVININDRIQDFPTVSTPQRKYTPKYFRTPSAEFGQFLRREQSEDSSLSSPTFETVNIEEMLRAIDEWEVAEFDQLHKGVYEDMGNGRRTSAWDRIVSMDPSTSRHLIKTILHKASGGRSASTSPTHDEIMEKMSLINSSKMLEEDDDGAYGRPIRVSPIHHEVKIPSLHNQQRKDESERMESGNKLVSKKLFKIEEAEDDDMNDDNDDDDNGEIESNDAEFDEKSQTTVLSVPVTNIIMVQPPLPRKPNVSIREKQSPKVLKAKPPPPK